MTVTCGMQDVVANAVTARSDKLACVMPDRRRTDWLRQYQALVLHSTTMVPKQALRCFQNSGLANAATAANATPAQTVVLWTTRYIDAAVAQLRAEGHGIRDEDVARLSPLKHKNLNVLGRYSFTATQPAGGNLRPLRDPDAARLDDDEDGTED